MKRRICSLVLTFFLLAGLTVPAFAAKADNLTAVYTYRNQFTDVPRSAWYYENVKSLYELGLTNGQGTRDRFAPDADITLAEAITLAARLRSLYETGSSETGPSLYGSDGGPWYMGYVTYAQKTGIISTEFKGQYGQNATRAQMAHIMAHTLPTSHFTSINEETVAEGYASQSYIRDVTEYTPYQQDILTLYRWGILSGTDRTGSFHPSEDIARSEVAAMLTRLVRSDLRITLDWDTASSASKAGTTYPDLISGGTYHSAPSSTDTQAIDDNIRYMLARDERTMTLHYGRGGLTERKVNELLTAFLNGIRFYAEQSYNEVECSYSSSTGTLMLTFSCSLWDDKMMDLYRDATLEHAIMIHDMLWENGTITSSMSQYDKARAYYTWLCGHCRYDHACTDSSLSHSAYSAFQSGLAVCDGYTAAYNLLLKLEGIDCSTMSTADNTHIWTVAVLDGVSYHIDPTWGDQTSAVTYRYFAMTEAVSLSRFP